MVPVPTWDCTAIWPLCFLITVVNHLSHGADRVDINAFIVHTIGMKNKKETKGVLILKDHSEVDEIDFELDYLLSLSIGERFRLMENKSLEIKYLLEQNGHRRPAEIIKRK